MKKIILAIAMFTSIGLIFIQMGTSARESIHVSINGQEQVYDQPPVIINDRVLVPLRGIFESLGATVNWDEDAKTISAGKGSMKISLQINNNQMSINGVLIKLEVAPQLINNRTMVPARVVAETLGATVTWDETTNAVFIQLPGMENGVPDDEQAKENVITSDPQYVKKEEEVNQLKAELDQMGLEMMRLDPNADEYQDRMDAYNQKRMEYRRKQKELAVVRKSLENKYEGETK